LVPIAAFLAGALLTILLPVTLLTALTVWYWIFSVRVPENVSRRESRTEASAATPGPTIRQALPPDPEA
jgi:hypothetical protein